MQGGLTFQNRAKRFVYKTDNFCSPPRFDNIKKKLQLNTNKAKLYVCPVPHSIGVIAPSIPTQSDENGYDIDQNGTLVKVPQDRKFSKEPYIKVSLYILLHLN